MVLKFLVFFFFLFFYLWELPHGYYASAFEVSVKCFVTNVSFQLEAFIVSSASLFEENPLEYGYLRP